MDSIRMIGYDAVHPDDFVYDVPQGHDCYLLILTHTPARFLQGGTMREYPPRQAALFAPHAPVCYGASGGSYGNDWMLFVSDEAYATRFPLLNEPFPVVDADYCHELFRLLTWEHMQENYEAVVSQLMSVLFHKLSADLRRSEGEGFDRELLALRRSIVNNPRQDWSVGEMASRLHISAGYLQLLYKRQFGVSCMEDVIHSRIRMARDYLAHTRMSVAEIAALCGYNSAEHFSRQFKRVCGASPGQYRRNEASGIGEELRL